MYNIYATTLDLSQESTVRVHITKAIEQHLLWLQSSGKLSNKNEVFVASDSVVYCGGYLCG